jgi:integrase
LGFPASRSFGRRRGEICGLEWIDVDLNRNILHIHHSMSRHENETLKDGKFYRVFPGEKSSLVPDSAKTLDSQGVDIKLVSHQLRHSDVSVTQNIYQHVTEALTKKSADAMDEIFNQKGIK